VVSSPFGHRRERTYPRFELTPQLSETRSGDQDLREADEARRRLQNRKRHYRQDRRPKAHNEPARKEPSQKQDHGWNHEHKEAEVHRHSVVVHGALVLIEAAQASGEDDQNQDVQGRTTPPSVQEITASHGIP